MSLVKISREEKDYLAKFQSLLSLSLNNNNLESLENLPDAPLCRLELNENELKGSELVHLDKFYRTLEKLKLAYNKIAVFEDLEILKKFKQLKSLELTGNPVTKLTDYKVKILQMLPSL